MTHAERYIVGTSGYSFADWVGTFYPSGTRPNEMFAHYAQRLNTVEINYTFYRMPAARTLETLERKTPEGFCFWIKANQLITHHQDRSAAPAFIDSLHPLRAAGKLAGVLMQFPQRFHRTVANRRFLAAAVKDFSEVPLAVEFRHRSWDHPSVPAGLRDRDVTLAVPDAPEIHSLYRPAPAATTRTGYLRLHSRDAGKWYAADGADRYDYNYSPGELQEIIDSWDRLGEQVDKVFTFFNNCHAGQAARNAEAFRRILEQLDNP